MGIKSVVKLNTGIAKFRRKKFHALECDNRTFEAKIPKTGTPTRKPSESLSLKNLVAKILL